MKKSVLTRVTPFIAASLAFAWFLQPPAPARAAGAPTPHYSVDRFTIGALLANPRTRAVLDEYLHGFSAARIAVKGRDETLREVQPFDSSRLTNAVLAKINAALAKIPATSVAAELSQPPNGPTQIPDAQLDPARHLQPSQLESVLHRPLPEQYIWTYPHTAHSYGLRPHYFRRSFQITSVPARATLYLAGPRQATIYLNGKEVGHYQLNLSFPMGVRVYQHDVARWLRPGKTCSPSRRYADRWPATKRRLRSVGTCAPGNCGGDD
ncbi:alfa-L-rhamnosidase, partial [mine drainage metagenome]